jgi:hypothetical protein
LNMHCNATKFVPPTLDKWSLSSGT